MRPWAILLLLSIAAAQDLTALCIKEAKDCTEFETCCFRETRLSGGYLINCDPKVSLGGQRRDLFCQRRGSPNSASSLSLLPLLIGSVLFTLAVR